ncbi:hypothetical protein SADUNF_Sadunf15G0026200 [Salix dunnii]|uniref:Uncharacterized protein n=1 Tax=Salix dunnii TaxID=1413687 RepID=A0A835JC81_9ROSI|nr:hypothetical protein SADUNF_Sadunf15G0026200 [Salix dunnii]
MGSAMPTQQQPGPGGANVFRHSQSMGSAMPTQQPQQQPGPGGVNVFSHSLSMGSAMPRQQQQQPPQEASYQQLNRGPNGSGNGTAIDTMVLGFVAGAAQQAGQMVVQSVINPGADGDSVGNNNNCDPNDGKGLVDVTATKANFPQIDTPGPKVQAHSTSGSKKPPPDNINKIL